MSRTYSPKDVDMSFGGTNIEGWTSVTISRNSGNSTAQEGADGYVAYTKDASRTGALELEVLQQNTAANAFLAEVQRVQDLNEDLQFFDIVISDKSGGVLVYCKRAHLSDPANQDLAAEAGGRTWGFFVERLQYSANPLSLVGDSNIDNAIAGVGTISGSTSNA